MKIDGDTSDWDWVPRKYIITEQMMNKNISANNSFWKCQIKVGWSDLNNKLYIIAKVTDDTLITNNSKYFTNDCMQFAINADNAGGFYVNGNSRTKYSVLYALVPTTEKTSKLLINAGPSWMQEKKYTNWSVKYYKDEKGEYEMVYELCLSLWDKWEDAGAEYSSSTELHPFKIIRLALAFNDADSSDGTFTEWANSAGRKWWRNADEIPEFILDMPLKKNDVSWQGICYVLSQ